MMTPVPLVSDRSYPTTIPPQLELDLTRDHTSSEACDHHTDEDEYMVGQIVKHVEKWDELHHVVQWYGCGPQNDRAESGAILNNIQQPLMETNQYER